jgi:hypothetical protein
MLFQIFWHGSTSNEQTGLNVFCHGVARKICARQQSQLIISKGNLRVNTSHFKRGGGLSIQVNICAKGTADLILDKGS